MVRVIQNWSKASLAVGGVITFAALVLLTTVFLADSSKLENIRDLLVWAGIVDAPLLAFGAFGVFLTP